MEATLTVSVDEAAHLLGVSRSHAYDLVGRGVLPAIRLGRRLRIPRGAVEGLVAVALEKVST